MKVCKKWYQMQRPMLSRLTIYTECLIFNMGFVYLRSVWKLKVSHLKLKFPSFCVGTDCGQIWTVQWGKTLQNAQNVFYPCPSRPEFSPSFPKHLLSSSYEPSPSPLPSEASCTSLSGTSGYRAGFSISEQCGPSHWYYLLNTHHKHFIAVAVPQ